MQTGMHSGLVHYRIPTAETKMWTRPEASVFRERESCAVEWALRRKGERVTTWRREGGGGRKEW